MVMSVPYRSARRSTRPPLPEGDADIFYRLLDIRAGLVHAAEVGAVYDLTPGQRGNLLEGLEDNRLRLIQAQLVAVALHNLLDYVRAVRKLKDNLVDHVAHGGLEVFLHQ